MKRLWDKGGDADEKVLRFTVGEDYLWDERLVEFDIQASQAHARMLAAQGLIPADVAEVLLARLAEVGAQHAAGEWAIQPEEEDAHTAIENRLGAEGAWVHLGRSRNDQVLAAVRLYLRATCDKLAALAENVAEVTSALGQQHGDCPMPGLTHMQRAMPSSVSLWAEGYATEFRDAAEGFRAAARRALRNPLGSAAGYGTPGLPINRAITTQELAFDAAHEPVTAVQLSRGKAEAAVAMECVLFLQDLGRLAADLVLFCTAEFGWVKLPEKFTTGSSIMPQKRNPDVFELVRAHSAQAAADLQSILALTTKMPSGYHRDLQLIKPPLFRLIDRTEDVAEVMAHVMPGVAFQRERLEACMDAGLYATEAAYNLVVSEGIPFREAYRRVGAQFRAGSE